MTEQNHANQFAMLVPVVAALVRRGFKASYDFPGYIEIEGHDFIYAPATDHWLWIHKDHRNAWSRLDVIDARDAEQIADGIVRHISDQKKGT